jgi:hypothetical protein
MLRKLSNSCITNERPKRIICGTFAFFLLNTGLQGLILSIVLTCLYNCVWFQDANHISTTLEIRDLGDIVCCKQINAVR